MDNNNSKSPYHGILISILFMVLPSVLCTWLFNYMIGSWQPEFGHELNWATAKLLGCGIGVLFHIGCFIKGDFSQELFVVINRIKEFFSYVFLFPALAFKCYWDDLKLNGVVFWIYLAIVTINTTIFVTALNDVLVLLK